ncbi:Hint domain-containing protein [Halovulum sp. GXIMD14793]
MGTYNISDLSGNTTGSGDEDSRDQWDGTLDVSSGSSITGDFDVETIGPFGGAAGEADSYTFNAPATTYGTFTFNATDGTWTFTSNGTASFGDTFTFQVTGDATDFFGTEFSDTDTVTITFTCFVEGARISTPAGPRAVQDLTVGDLVSTRDSGALPVRWVGHRTIDAPSGMAPVVFVPGAIGNTAELRVSPHHRMLMTGWRAEALFGEKEVLVAAKDMVNGDTIYRADAGPVTYWHIMFDRHEIVTSEGVPSESFHPAAAGLDALEQAVRNEVLELFSELRDNPASYGPPVRMPLTVSEASLLAC